MLSICSFFVMLNNFTVKNVSKAGLSIQHGLKILQLNHKTYHIRRRYTFRRDKPFVLIDSCEA